MTTFRPEFINRIDETLTFHPLGGESTWSRSRRSNSGCFQKRLAEPRQSSSRIDRRSVRGVLARRGHDPMYGARPLKRLMQREIENPLARRILSRRIR